MRKMTAVVLCVGLLLLGSGCKSAAQKPGGENQPESQVQQTNDADKRIMSSNFSNLATTINGVQKATVVVDSAEAQVPGQSSDLSGKMVVMVGLELDNKAQADANQVQNIQMEVKSKIMSSDQRISEVLITTNPEMIKKLQDVAAGVIQGKPVQSYAQDIEELNKNIRGQ